MNEKTRIQIEEMKKPSFGIEIEGNGITRKKAAEVAARFFGTEAYNAAAQYGYSTWACKDQDGRTWKFSKDVSIQGPDDQKVEMITPVLFYDKDMASLQRLVRELRHAGMRSTPDQSCGVHIHISNEGHTPQTIRNLVNLYAAHEQQILKAIRVDRTRESRYCRTVDPDFLERLNKQKPKTMEELERCWYNGTPDHSRYSGTRYRVLNLHALFQRYHTIEIRCFNFDNAGDGRRGGLHAGQLRSMVLLSLAMNQLAKQVKYASPKPQQTENERYAFRVFLLRLGFIGDEFKTPRKYFIRNTEGNSAWRHGRP